MYAGQRSETTVAVSSFSTMSGDEGGAISKVLILNGDANSALAALLSDLEDLGSACLAGNQVEALRSLRLAAYGY